jgi:D-xylose transport system substrate-binding protein
MLTVLGACSSGSGNKVGFLMPNLIDGRYAQEKIYFSEKIRSLGGEAIVVSAENNDALQVKQANELIDQGCNVLVLNSVNKVTSAQIVRKAHEENVKIIAYERIISNSDPDYFISFDNVKVGEMMAKFAVERNPTGNYFLLCGDKSDQNALWVKQGFLNILKPSIDANKIKIIYDTYIEAWSGSEAEIQMKQYIALSGLIPDVILSAYDGLSTGAIKVLDANNITTFPLITGQDAELEACRNIVKGKQSMTVYKAFKLEAETAADMALQIAGGKKINCKSTISNGTIDIPSVLLDPVTVDSNNIRDVLVKSGYLKESDLALQE